MCSQKANRCTSVLTFLLIVILIVLIVIVWTQFSVNNIRSNQELNMTTIIEETYMTHVSRTKHKDLIQRVSPVPPPALTTSTINSLNKQEEKPPDVELVKPIKIGPKQLTNQDLIYDKLHNINNHGKPQPPHHSGHFRHKTAEVWDPHPSYEIHAFGQTLVLDLENNNKFIMPDLHITKHIHDNYTQRVRHDPKAARCFYTGKIHGDSESMIAVSLCNGMTGYIRTSKETFYIEPEKSANSTLMDSFLHKLKRVPHPISIGDGVKSTSKTDETIRINHADRPTIIEDDFPPDEEFETRHIIHKRDLVFDNLETFNADRKNLIHNELYRTTRDTDWVRNSDNYNNEHFIKVLLVVDKTMVDYHRHHELTDYILTLMSHVALLYKDATIGNAISVAVVNIRILERKQFPNSNSQDMLRQFCDWQADHTQLKNHNAAFLITRAAICKNSSTNECNTLGLAEVGGMCSSGCSIVRDTGLSTSYTIAHEIGHLLDMPHDDDKRCNELNRGTKRKNIMSKTMQNDTKPWIWSPCSKHYVTEFLDSNRAKCMQYPPSVDILPSNYIRKLPGENFEADRQCELEFGNGSTICPYQPHCADLWCTEGEGGCRTHHLFWAEGTSCGFDKWCYHGKCIALDRDHLRPINGGWNQWQSYGPCSRTCGGGIKKSTRICDSPRPENGGTYCSGISVRYESCNTMDCDTITPDFRTVQCAEFNGNAKIMQNITEDIEWVPKYGLENPDEYCRLYCRPKNNNAYYMLKDKVLDGTKCGLTSFNICVNGLCKDGGCDNKLDSNITLDNCGICGGNNSKCRTIEGFYNVTKSGYSKVFRFPKGSSNITITQTPYDDSVDDNYLALIDGESGNYTLNGDNILVTHETDVVFGSLIIKYSGSYAHIEKITTPSFHKLSKDLVLLVLSVGKVTPPNIHYTYVISKDDVPTYSWSYNKNRWSKCNSICSGKQYLLPTCVKLPTKTPVADSFCENLDNTDSIPSKDCNKRCQLTWNIESRSACSAHCGLGLRNIYYNCMKVYLENENYSELVDEKHCRILPKPPSYETCNTVCNRTRWDYSDWSDCSVTCNGGIQRRTAHCVDDTRTPIDNAHCNNNEKITQQICNTNKCPVWRSEESSCSVPCGGGYKNISHYCHIDGRIYNPLACDQNQRPPDTEKCNTQPCVRWLPEPWSQCSVSCGIGIEHRYFECKTIEKDEIIDRSYCKDMRKPKDESRTCRLAHCEEVIALPYVDDINDNSINRYGERFKWIGGEWTACSKPCDTGVSYEIFRCKNENDEENEVSCNPHEKPSNLIHCNRNSCPKWKTGDWSPNCDSSCERHRQVRCINYLNDIVDDSKCTSHGKPLHSVRCKAVECAPRSQEKRYKWKMSKWKQCSNSCGKGTRRRHIDCEDTLTESIVVDSLCQHLAKPKATKPCERFSCKYAWIESYWSSCSKSCGAGIKTRNVTCHRVHRGGVVDPVALPDIYSNKLHNNNFDNYCSMNHIPASKAKCLLRHCTDEYAWQVNEWKPCTHNCGRKGRQIRDVYCVNVKTKQKIARFLCPKQLKPGRKRKCNQWKCLNKSCKEIKHHFRTKQNSDYLIAIKGRPVQIYCYKMDTPDPEEYISLHENERNYAEFYDQRLNNPHSCPHGGQRYENCTCNVINDRSGLTQFWKIRLNITSMTIIGNDFTFSKQHRGIQIDYGTAGDCYSSIKNCAQGRFSLDLSSTSFRLTSNVRWKTHGNNASSEIRQSYTSVSGKCGGYCGKCMPDPSIGLQVEIT